MTWCFVEEVVGEIVEVVGVSGRCSRSRGGSCVRRGGSGRLTLWRAPVVAKIVGIVVEVEVDVESELLWRTMTVHSPPQK